MGLLDNFANMAPEDQQAWSSALMQASQALLTPGARGGGLGAAFAAFPQAIERAKVQAQRARLLGLQEKQAGLQSDKLGFDMEQARAQQAQQDALRQQIDQWVRTLPPEQQQVARLMPQEFAKTMLPQAPKLETIYTPQGQEQKAWVRGPGIDPLPVGGAKQPQMPWEYETGPDGQPRMRPGVFNAKQSIASAGAGKNSVTMVQEPAEAKKVGEYYGQQFADVQKAGLEASGKINRLDRMQQLLSGLETGKLTPAMTEVKSALEAVGIPVDKNLGSLQAAQALSNEMALQARNPSGGAGMPGAMSDADRVFLQNTVPNLSKTPEGNRMLIETNKRLAQRDQQVAKMARDYRSKKGHLDEGFFNELQAYSDAHPLFSDIQSPQGFSIRKLP